MYIDRGCRSLCAGNILEYTCILGFVNRRLRLGFKVDLENIDLWHCCVANQILSALELIIVREN